MSVIDGKSFLNKKIDGDTSGAMAAGQAIYNNMVIWMFILLPTSIMAFGAGYCLFGFGVVAGNFVNWMFFSRRMKGYIQLSKSKIYNEADFLGARYESKTIKMIFSLVWIVSMMAIIVMLLEYFGVAIARYTFMKAWVARTILIACIFLLIIFVKQNILRAVKGLACFFAFLYTTGVVTFLVIHYKPRNILQLFLDSHVKNGISVYLNILYADGVHLSIPRIISMLFVGIGCLGMPFVFREIVGTRDDKEIDKAIMVGILGELAIVISTAVVFLLMLPLVYPEKISIDSELMYIYKKMIDNAITNEHHAKIFAIVTFCIYLFLIVTLISSLIQNVSELFRGIIPKIKIVKHETSKLILDMDVVAVVCILALVATVFVKEYNKMIIVDAWDICGALVAAPVTMALLSKKATATGVIWGMISALLFIAFWKYCPVMGGETMYQYTEVYACVPGAVLNLLVIIFVSRFTKNVSEEQLKLLEHVRINQK